MGFDRRMFSEAEQDIELQMRRLAECPTCTARVLRACKSGLGTINVGHTGRMRVALTHPDWTGPRPLLDIQPGCPVCATDRIGHLKIRLQTEQERQPSDGHTDLG